MSENFFVYVLGSEVSTIFHTYVGWTNDLDRRLVKHNMGQGARFTKGRKWQLLYAERYKTKSEAMSREWYLKRDRKFRKQFSNVRWNKHPVKIF